MENDKNIKNPKMYYGWWIVIAAALQGMFANGVISNGFSRFFEPIRGDLSISYLQMSLVFSLQRAEGGMGGPIVGFLVDKYGARPMIIFGGFCAGIGLVLVSFAQNYWQLVALFVGIVSLGKTAGTGQTLMALVNRWFVKKKAIAMSTLMTSFAAGGAVVVPLLNYGITQFGWRSTVFYMGLFIFVLTIPVSLIIRSKPEDLGLLPDGDQPMDPNDETDNLSTNQQTQDFTVREALSSLSFWFIMIGLVTRTSATNALLIHWFPIMALSGIGSSGATRLFALMMGLAIPLRFFMGWAVDFFPPRIILFTGMMAGAIGVLILWWFGNIWGALGFAVCISLIEGITSTNWLMLANYFGQSKFATLMGILSLFHNSFMFISPLYAGWLRDSTNSYSVALLTFAPMFAIGAISFALAKKPIHR
ncbi:MAG TPA: hypothetical protein DEZ08_08080 [Dehalococcoidia bacterium]|nr:hypothetical protein [Dehalococcoidia bacterium]